MNALTKQKYKYRAINTKIVLLAGMVVLLFLVRCVVAQEVAPDFTLTDIDGVEISLSDYRGRVVLLDFFATWCSVCVAEIPYLKSLHDEFGDDLTIITISVSPSSDTVEKLQQFRQTHEIDWVVARDTIGINDAYDVTYIPTLVIVDQEGYIRHQHSGPTDESVLREEIHEIMHAPVDTVSPNIEILSPENNTYTTSSVLLNFIIDEAPSWIGYSFDGKKNVTISGNSTIVGLSDGSHTLTVYAKDVAGNMGYSEMVYFVIQDSTPPALSVASPKNKTHNAANIPLTFLTDEPVSWMAYSLDGQANMTITGNTTLSGLSDGSYSLIVYARDMVGNTGASEKICFSVKIQARPFPMLILAIALIIPGVGAALLVYFTKVKKQIGKISR